MRRCPSASSPARANRSARGPRRLVALDAEPHQPRRRTPLIGEPLGDRRAEPGAHAVVLDGDDAAAPRRRSASPRRRDRAGMATMPTSTSTPSSRSRSAAATAAPASVPIVRTTRIGALARPHDLAVARTRSRRRRAARRRRRGWGSLLRPIATATSRRRCRCQEMSGARRPRPPNRGLESPASKIVRKSDVGPGTIGVDATSFGVASCCNQHDDDRSKTNC